MDILNKLFEGIGEMLASVPPDVWFYGVLGLAALWMLKVIVGRFRRWLGNRNARKHAAKRYNKQLDAAQKAVQDAFQKRNRDANPDLDDTRHALIAALDTVLAIEAEMIQRRAEEDPAGADAEALAKTRDDAERMRQSLLNPSDSTPDADSPAKPESETGEDADKGEASSTETPDTSKEATPTEDPTDIVRTWGDGTADGNTSNRDDKKS